MSEPSAPTASSPASAFVSHASEDKVFARHLADAIARAGVKIWFDAYEIRIGDRIRDRINEGLRNSSHGVVILSADFFAKKWPKDELAALSALLQEGRIFPVLHGISVTDLGVFDPLLLGIRAESSKMGAKELAKLIVTQIKGPRHVDDEGLTVYTHEVVRLVDIALGDSASIEDVLFDGCLLQGPAVLFVYRDNLEITETEFNGVKQFWASPAPDTGVGAIGLRRSRIRGCKFKEVGITGAPDVLDRIIESAESGTFRPLPPFLQ